MHVLILGCSDIVRRRVFPALAALAEVERIDVASRSKSAASALPTHGSTRWFADYAEALSESEADLVYISLVNSEHATWARNALLAGKHVIVDKPACLGLDAATALAELAAANGLCLAESTVYPRHPQFRAMSERFAETPGGPTRIVAVFSFPPFPPENFRCHPELGGGALWDLGPYAVSLGRVFWRVPAGDVACRVVARQGPGGLVTSFSLLATYPGERSLVGHFGFSTVYRNQLTLLGSELAIDTARAFTTPADLPLELRVRTAQQDEVLSVPAADTFALFLREVLAAIDARDFEGFRRDLLEDAAAIERLRHSAGEA